MSGLPCGGDTCCAPTVGEGQALSWALTSQSQKLQRGRHRTAPGDPEVPQILEAEPLELDCAGPAEAAARPWPISWPAGPPKRSQFRGLG